MDLTNIKTIKKLCQEYGLHPNRSNGQNFLIDRNILEKIVAAGEIKKDDMILEIGPGFGVLTQELVKYSGQVVAVEKDRRLAEYLSEHKTKLIEHRNNLEIINKDILRFKIYDLGFKNFKIISNLPYQITSPVLWKFLHYDHLSPVLPLVRGGGLESMVLMVQKEVGERICAQKGQMSILSVLCQLYADCEIVAPVSRNCFWPVPEVDSVTVKLKIKDKEFINPPLSPSGLRPPLEKGGIMDIKEFMRLVKIGFSAKRKMLKNNLAGGLQLPMDKVVLTLQKAGLDEKIRAQELAIKDWIELYSFFNN
ncbi:MAG TPA: 16S rRNA (adenine(1518)-N(6)/adenine(1519)-N(6))-dimethyltransferase RsmA [bacterium]|nr:16S rRNA (adenine(1518)-N(6)/adenine(1519)-N(6))-dimethyltransferase RsmA [bacterium]HPL95592.1 16S rRNA (adenine(1518)-N(6)/adenine(1519)-N(6))-dimethyltransferase RsmA [bacterium]